MDVGARMGLGCVSGAPVAWAHGQWHMQCKDCMQPVTPCFVVPAKARLTGPRDFCPWRLMASQWLLRWHTHGFKLSTVSWTENQRAPLAIPKELSHSNNIWNDGDCHCYHVSLVWERENRNKPRLAQKSPQAQLALARKEMPHSGDRVASYGQLFPTAEGRGSKKRVRYNWHILLRICKGYSIFILQYDCHCTYS